MDKSNFNSSQEAPKTQQDSSLGDTENPDTETQGINLSQPPADEASASNGRQPPPCRFFARGRCKYGDACRFQHVGSQTLGSSAANGTGSDDRVCRFYQQGRCRFGDSCRFRHIQPPAIEENDEDEDELDPLQLAMLFQLMQGCQGLTEEVLKEDLEQRFWNCGFTDEEVFELACQGVKPWDDDAEAVLDVLNNGWDYDFSDVDYEDFDLGSLDLGNSNDDDS